MKNIAKIIEYLKNGETTKKCLGVEIEFFLCDSEGNLIEFAELDEILQAMAEKYNWDKIYEEEKVIGLKCPDYTITLEPAGQLEVSINTFADIENIERVYDEFVFCWAPVFAEAGFDMINCGVFPQVETGEAEAKELPLIPKKRYAYMDEYFEKTGKLGRYMMRATASTQVSIDYSSEEDCMRKIKILQKLTPFLMLLMENTSGMGVRKEWLPHLLRMQIWEDVDSARCGYIPGSFDDDFCYEAYARYVYETPFILLAKDNDVAGVGNMSAREYVGEDELDFTEHLLTMFFNHVRLKNYIEIRFADSVSKKKMLGYVALIKGLMYSEDSLAALEKLLWGIESISSLKQIERNIEKTGYDGLVCDKKAVEWLVDIYNIAKSNLSEKDQEYLVGVLTLPMGEYIYKQSINEDKAHGESFYKHKEYMLNSTAKYHGRVARTMYMPKLFTEQEVERLKNDVRILFGIFDKVVHRYEIDEEFRKLFGFDERLETLILREKNYSCNIPMARVDLFYNENTGEYKFCEFNTDGSSAMNEDRELNNGLKLTKAYKDFTDKIKVKTFELFDTWVDEFVDIYGEYLSYKCNNKKANELSDIKFNVVITDFLEHATVNEFKIFQERFIARGINCEICDIRELSYDGNILTTSTGMKVDAIYRRAVTSDIMHHYHEVGDFIQAVKDGSVCLVGDFRTQLVHNKILFKILHLPETKKLFTKTEQRYIKNHIPYTVSLTEDIVKNNSSLWENVKYNKDNWIIKPEDSYGSLGVHAGVECDEKQWLGFVEEALDNHYILQEFCKPYRLMNVEWNMEELDKPIWRGTANLTGIFVYNGKMKGLYSRISYDEMISTQYNEMTLPTVII